MYDQCNIPLRKSTYLFFSLKSSKKLTYLNRFHHKKRPLFQTYRFFVSHNSMISLLSEYQDHYSIQSVIRGILISTELILSISRIFSDKYLKWYFLVAFNQMKTANISTFNFYQWSYFN